MKYALHNHLVLQARQNISKSARADKRIYWTKQAQDLEADAEQNKTRDLFTKIRKTVGFTNNHGSYTLSSKDGTLLNTPESRTQRWTEYHSELLNPPAKNTEPEPEPQQKQQSETNNPMDNSQGYDEDPSDYFAAPPPQPEPDPLLPNWQHLTQTIDIEEVRNAIKAAKNWKATGPDQIAAELLKCNLHWCTKWLTIVFNWCLQTKYIPQEWKDCSIINIFKGQGDAGKCTNYRGISLLSVIGKCFSHVLVNRIVSVSDFSFLDAQFGFRRLRGTAHAQCILQRLVE